MTNVNSLYKVHLILFVKFLESVKGFDRNFTKALNKTVKKIEEHA